MRCLKSQKYLGSLFALEVFSKLVYLCPRLGRNSHIFVFLLVASFFMKFAHHHHLKFHIKHSADSCGLESFNFNKNKKLSQRNKLGWFKRPTIKYWVFYGIWYFRIAFETFLILCKSDWANSFSTGLVFLAALAALCLPWSLTDSLTYWLFGIQGHLPNQTKTSQK